ncbi:MAG: hypothetical protein ACI8PG_004042, partial [Planctomycetota bacterium]
RKFLVRIDRLPIEKFANSRLARLFIPHKPSE